ncbi:HCL369Wp [Eremothecium sinecaudum]|uniref:DNA-directed RNA polymerases I, II, and III subunit RPABC3 n=1 Tax=Eremothecium sinecaudum TaxID=45286 RepID=A0A109UYQ9_9SACH|nr:HCL369Wp [Eremothecium sinecaudum]AMD19782.1 HCL369Wp [Eremothecium sinecaudum]
MSATLFDDLFTIQEVSKGSYNKVSRIEAISTSQESCKLTLDVNTELFPLKPQQQLTVMLATTLNLDNTKEAQNSWRAPAPGTRSLADDFDYVMYGTAYKFEEANGNKDILAVYYSFGGLLMRLEGNYRLLTNFKQENVYLLCRADH